ncbi:hypothetical protein SLNWT_3995 [Streptomyces albus]|uniref:Uncharacterized protein n=1 Tax=Streptomyces albus (strain ATCC 21838 / DSM 41398 / FERM P-419 / JCM 4703 / NBRC 107858) TaxID=1081613 RepID=A0A0B5F0J4_STRA4|nr:hypothetical protein SLNWT_3995 [Streptomyces albus]AOU78679.1 hypothetical protein SLNHY_3988 [Streptomyces albus]
MRTARHVRHARGRAAGEEERSETPEAGTRSGIPASGLE